MPYTLFFPQYQVCGDSETDQIEDHHDHEHRLNSDCTHHTYSYGPNAAEIQARLFPSFHSKSKPLTLGYSDQLRVSLTPRLQRGVPASECKSAASTASRPLSQSPVLRSSRRSIWLTSFISMINKLTVGIHATRGPGWRLVSSLANPGAKVRRQWNEVSWP